jgi:hypothetical protein
MDETYNVGTAILQKNTYNSYDDWFNVGQMSWDGSFY